MSDMRAALPTLLAFALTLAGAAACAPAAAADGADGGPDFKLTLGRYGSSDGNTGLDANLRGGLGPHTAWVGLYRDQSGYRQARAGYEFRLDGEAVRTVFSLQSASGGVAVGSVTSEVGGANYAIIGWGRTNVRNYVNLNYDPNDAITLGVGTRAISQTELTLFNIHDDRLHTGQNVTHFVLRRRFDNEQRVTVDVFVKRGLTGDGYFVRNDKSISLGYDRGPLFVRFAYDPHAGFAAPTQRRLQFGTRF
jgi:hypothetical protein